MGQVISVPESGMDYILYGNKNNVLSNYLYNQLQQLPQQFNEFSNRIYNNIQDTYNFVNDKLVQYGIMNQLEKQNIHIIDNYIEELLSYQALNAANITMQRYVMAHQGLRQLYTDQNVDGYSDTYKNMFHKDVGEQHYDYRRVMDGVVQTDLGYDWVIKNYHDNLEIGDRELEHNEKVKILNTWEAIDWFLDTCKFDFTHISDEPVKINR